MSISGIDNRREKMVTTDFVYLFTTPLCILFGAVYEHFSLQIFSYYRDYAFVFPMGQCKFSCVLYDFWVALGHQMKYKHRIRHEKIIQDELKLCADEIVSVDVSMQTTCNIMRVDAWK